VPTERLQPGPQTNQQLGFNVTSTLQSLCRDNFIAILRFHRGIKFYLKVNLVVLV